MKRKWLIPLAVVVAVAGLVAGYFIFVKSDNLPVSSSGDSSHEVNADGGTFTFHDGIEIDVPEGAVEDGTTLSVGTLSHVAADGHAPFAGMRTGAVAFDVSLSKDGNDNIQPALPLDIKLPLEGNLLPEGANPESALLYSANESGDGFWYMPPPLDEQGMPEKIEEGALYGRMYHLSPKYVSYLDEAKFLEEFGMVSGGIEQPEDCLEKVENSAGEVEFGPNSEGWSNTDPASPINACLAADGDGTHVGIVNRVNYILSVASTTDSQHLETSYNDFEEEMVKTFASTIFPNERIDTFFGREGRMDATFAPEDLPATIQMKADPNTYLSEIGWFALKFLANVFTGGMASEAVQALLEVPDVISCLQTTFDIGEGDVEGFSLLDAINYVSSTCVQVIAEAVGYQPSFWDYLGRLFGVVAEGVAGGLQTIVTAAEGIRMQFVGTLTVEILPVASYVGEWGLHAASLIVDADGTGMFSYNQGSCGENGEDHCQGYVKFEWELTDDQKLLGTFIERWAEGYEGVYTPENSPNEHWSDLPGETFTLYDLNDQASLEFIRNDVEDVPHHFCGPEASDEDLLLCGLL